MTCLPLVAISLGLALYIQPQPAPTHPSSSTPQEETRAVKGTWDLRVESPHGQIAMTMTLDQKGTSVKGTLRTAMGDRPVTGEFVKRRLKAEATDPNSPKWIITADLADDGELRGVVSTAMQDLPFKASRSGQ